MNVDFVDVAVLFRDLEGHSQNASVTRAETMGIRSYGISMTSLEEVFLKIGIEETVNDEGSDALDNVPESSPLLSREQNNDTSSPRQNSGSKNRVSPTPENNPPKNTATNGISERNDTNKVNIDMKSVITTPATIPKAKMVDGKDLRNQRFWALCKVRATLLIRDPGLFLFRIVFPVIFIIVGAAVMSFGPRPERADSTTSLNLNIGMYSKINGEPENDNPTTLLQMPPPVEANVTDFIDTLSAQDIALRNITNETDLLDIAPHHTGLKLYSVDAINSPITSDITVLYNDTAIHSVPATVNVISNTLLKMLTSASESITTHVQYWPNLKDLSIGYDNSFMSSVILLGLAMSIIPPGFGIVCVREREVKV